MEKKCYLAPAVRYNAVLRTSLLAGSGSGTPGSNPGGVGSDGNSDGGSSANVGKGDGEMGEVGARKRSGMLDM